MYTADRVASRTVSVVKSTHEVVKDYPSMWTDGPQMPVYVPWPESNDPAAIMGAIIVVPPSFIISGTVSLLVWLTTALVGTVTFGAAHAVAATGGVMAGLIEGMYLDADRMVRVLCMEPRDYVQRSEAN
jgi:hypothetical protein